MNNTFVFVRIRLYDSYTKHTDTDTDTDTD
jgi:hypothetical protein